MDSNTFLAVVTALFAFLLFKSIKVPYSKIIGINPYSDGMEVQRDGNNVKRLVFQGFDCSFVLNVINVISN